MYNYQQSKVVVKSPSRLFFTPVNLYYCISPFQNTMYLLIFVDAENLFEHELGALNMAALLRKEERAGLLSNLGPCCKALCFRRDSAIRKQLMKNEKASDLFTELG